MSKISSQNPVLKWLTRLFVLHGPMLVLAFYVTWAAGRLSLGYWPRPSLDDPKGISGIGPFYFFTGLLAVSFPAVLLMSAGIALFSLIRGECEFPYLMIKGAMCWLLMAAAIGVLRWDPHGVVNWFFD